MTTFEMWWVFKTKENILNKLNRLTFENFEIILIEGVIYHSQAIIIRPVKIIQVENSRDWDYESAFGDPTEINVVQFRCSLHSVDLSFKKEERLFTSQPSWLFYDCQEADGNILPIHLHQELIKKNFSTRRGYISPSSWSSSTSSSFLRGIGKKFQSRLFWNEFEWNIFPLLTTASKNKFFFLLTDQMGLWNKLQSMENIQTVT